MLRALAMPMAASLLVPLAGCYVGYHGDVSTRAVVGAAIVAGIVAAGENRYYMVGPDGLKIPLGYAPEPDPTRRINVQDCTRPVDAAAGNLVCR